MKFADGYFGEEVREGFFVPDMMKRCWAAQLEVLAVVQKVCRDYDIQYFADWGTLLGAVRHGGMIPWDDDLDLCMKRSDYERFMAVAGDALPEGYVIRSIRTFDTHNTVVEVINSIWLVTPDETREKHHGFPFAAGLDIFVLDYIPRDAQMQQMLKNWLSFIDMMVIGIDEGNLVGERLEQCIREVEATACVTVDREKPLARQLLLAAERIPMMFRDEEADELSVMHNYLARDYRIPKECYAKGILVPFENTEIVVPAGYETVLRTEYGAGWAVPVSKGGAHSYPGYKKEAEDAKEYGEFELPKYEFSREELEKGEKTHVSLKTEYLERTGQGTREKKEIVFVPYKAACWGALESVWRAAVEDENTDVYVVPAFYYEKGDYKTILSEEMHYETDYPEEVVITPFTEYKFEEHFPDKIIIQCPYDKYNDAYTLHPFFFAETLKKYTDELILIPPFVVNEIAPDDERARETLSSYCNTPGFVHADKIIVQSEAVKEVFVELLTEFAGEGTEKIWEHKILASGSPLWDQDGEKNFSGQDGEAVPPEWQQKICRPDGSRKKVILYHTSASTVFCLGEHAIAKMKEVFCLFEREQEEITVLWHPDLKTEELLSGTEPAIQQGYLALMAEYGGADWVVYDDSREMERAVSVCDAYYGDGGCLANLCRQAKKPVMIQTVPEEDQT